MKLQQNKPSRTLGILFVIVIMVVLTSGLAPPVGAQDSSNSLALKWETGIWGTEVDANGVNVVLNHADMRAGFDR
jgi:hypothetical protein